MDPSGLKQQAQLAAQQGQDLYNRFNTQAGQSQNDYNTYKGQASTANQNLQDYANYMKGAGSGTNLYNTGLSSAEQQVGFDPKVLATATQNLTQGQNALYSLNQAAQSSTGGYGLSGAQLGNYYASQSQPLSNQVQTQGQAVGNLSNLLQLSQNQANQYAGAGLQGEQVTEKGLNDIFTNAQSQATQAMQNMQFYSQLAQQQGGLNASEQQAYDTALQAYAGAQQAYAMAAQARAQAGLFSSQTTGQNIQNQAAQQQLAANQKAAAAQKTPQQLNSAKYVAANPINPNQKPATNFFNNIDKAFPTIFGQGYAG